MPRPSATAPAQPEPAEDYPWAGEAVRSALLLREGIVDLDPPGGVHAPTARQARPLVEVAAIEQALAAEGAAPLTRRTLVLAVGSNQTPQTIAGKYRRSGRDLQVATPFLRCTVHHLAVGHVAHSSARGYVAAAPYRAPGERMELVATWFDQAQLAVLDGTEPNYHRLRLRAEDFPLTLATGEQPAHVDVYASRWGLIGRERPIPLRHRQQELFDELLGRTGAELLGGDAAAVCARLAAHPEALHQLLRAHGLVVRDGVPRDTADGVVR
jgi:hypothetical protein